MSWLDRLLGREKKATSETTDEGAHAAQEAMTPEHPEDREQAGQEEAQPPGTS